MAHTRRVNKELKRLARMKQDSFRIEARGGFGCDGTYSFDAFVRGPEGTVFEGRMVPLQIAFTDGYPENKPVVRTSIPVFHPNISITSGEICVSTLNDWTKQCTIAEVLMSICIILQEVNVDSPFNNEAAEVWVAMENGDEGAKKRIVEHVSTLPTCDLDASLSALVESS